MKINKYVSVTQIIIVIIIIITIIISYSHHVPFLKYLYWPASGC